MAFSEVEKGACPLYMQLASGLNKDLYNQDQNQLVIA